MVVRWWRVFYFCLSYLFIYLFIILFLDPLEALHLSQSDLLILVIPLILYLRLSQIRKMGPWPKQPLILLPTAQSPRETEVAHIFFFQMGQRWYVCHILMLYWRVKGLVFEETVILLWWETKLQNLISNELIKVNWITTVQRLRSFFLYFYGRNLILSNCLMWIFPVFDCYWFSKIALTAKSN